MQQECNKSSRMDWEEFHNRMDWKAWIQRIEAAFKHVKLGDGMSLLETEWATIDGTIKSASNDVPMLSSNRAAARQKDLDDSDDWRNITFAPEELVTLLEAGGGPMLLDAEGWRFYLPVAMRAYLLQPEFLDTPLEQEFSVCMVEGVRRKNATFYSALSDEQFSLMQEFVAFLESDSETSDSDGEQTSSEEEDEED